jgi:hypothetical protein
MKVSHLGDWLAWGPARCLVLVNYDGGPHRAMNSKRAQAKLFYKTETDAKRVE